MNILMRTGLFLVCLLSLDASARQDPVPVKKAVEEFLSIQTKGLPGQISFTVSGIDPDNRLAPCPAPLEAAMPPGSRAWGRVNVVVRCPTNGGWSLFVRAQIHVMADYLVSTKAIAQGQALTDTDLAHMTGDLGDLPAGILTDPSLAIGKTAVLSIPAGRPLRADMLRQATVVQQNQSVKVISRGAGFQVASEGRALTNGFDGQVVQVRLGNGQVLSGIARAGGVVEVAY